MFRASLCPSSGAQEYYTMVAACGILCCGFSSSWSGVELRVMRPVCRMLHGQNHIKFAKGLKKRVFILRKILTVLLSPPLLS